MKKLILICALAFTAVALPLTQSGCAGGGVTLAAGGVYTDPVLAVADQSILDSSHALTGFVDWTSANSAFLAKYPEVLVLATSVSAQKDGWIKSAYAARDSYAAAAAAYRAGTGDPATVSAKQAALQGALAVLVNISNQIVAARAAHPVNAN